MAHILCPPPASTELAGVHRSLLQVILQANIKVFSHINEQVLSDALLGYLYLLIWIVPHFSSSIIRLRYVVADFV